VIVEFVASQLTPWKPPQGSLSGTPFEQSQGETDKEANVGISKAMEQRALAWVDGIAVRARGMLKVKRRRRRRRRREKGVDALMTAPLLFVSSMSISEVKSMKKMDGPQSSLFSFSSFSPCRSRLRESARSRAVGRRFREFVFINSHMSYCNMIYFYL